ncbi:unnamed protein product, partial [Sphenostylis stenocarpa]
GRISVPKAAKEAQDKQGGVRRIKESRNLFFSPFTSSAPTLLARLDFRGIHTAHTPLGYSKVRTGLCLAVDDEGIESVTCCLETLQRDRYFANHELRYRARHVLSNNIDAPQKLAKLN